VTAPPPLVLLVEDEPAVRRFLRAALAAHGYHLVEAGTVREATQLATSHNPDLFLVDLGLPDGDGIELARALREWTRAPIIVLSARGREEDKVNALDAGADDYVTKPFGTNELLARMRVALRHAQAAPKEPTRIEAGGLRIELDRHVVTVAEREVHLTPIEYKLLVLLARNAGKVLTHRQILSSVWGPNATQSHYVRVHMAELRKKIEPDPARPALILTELGVGYRFREIADAE
jgi:two-component system KDP operon response regulator KdpE